jgi:crotonobetainyl-CoA:carnitine CoA-transferase CaiB-like acyl-CoA transferase
VRVVDLSRVLAGPYATMTLADLGADVVKIEHPAGGDETRAWGPPFVGGESAYFLSVNRGKRSVALDLKDPDGSELALELCARADIVIENFRPGGAARLGLDYQAVRKRRHDVVYCTISGFGAREPRDRAGYDFTVQAESGLMAITGEPDGEPMKVGVAIVDVLAGLYAATAILAALRRRELTGEGDLVEVSLLDSAFAALVNVGATALLTGAEPLRYGNAHPSIVPYQPFRAADGSDLSRRNARVEQPTLPLPGRAAGEHRLKLCDQRFPVQNPRLVCRVPIIGGEVGPLDRSAKPCVEPVIGSSHRDPTIGGAEGLVGDDARVRVAVAQRLGPREQCVRADVDEGGEGAVEE